MPAYIHELPDWPHFRWNEKTIASQLAAVRHRQGRLLGRMESLGFKLREEATLRTLTEEAVKSSEIEGEILDKEQVRSSIARRLGLEAGTLAVVDRNVEGIVDVVIDATRNYSQPLTEDRLFGWHAALFPTGWSGLRRVRVAAWRTEGIEVVSGPEGKQRVHFEGPPAPRLGDEMRAFLTWFEDRTEIGLDPVLKAGIAHFWFVTIHPFEDGNGRIARAIADLALARSEGTEQRFYSVSAQIRRERNRYYDSLEDAQKGDLDITAQLEWFLGCLDRAFTGAEAVLGEVLRESEVLGGARGRNIQRAAMHGNQPLAGWIPRQADILDVGQTHKVVAGDRRPRH